MSAKTTKPNQNIASKLTTVELSALANFLYNRFEKSKLQNTQHKRNNNGYEAKS